jgi:phage repressor protein C with HTH and peptisase S24 domain
MSTGDGDPNLEQVPAVAKAMAPAEWTENRQSVRCVRVTGEGMAPLIGDGSIVAVDLSQFEVSTLSNQVVLAWHKDHGLLIRRLKRLGTTDMLIADADRNGTSSLTLDASWRILGRVIWWLSRTR